VEKEDFGMLAGGEATRQHPKPLPSESPEILPGIPYRSSPDFSSGLL